MLGQCRACHQGDETAHDGIGPRLNGLFGRKAGSVEGYAFSAATKAPESLERGHVWHLHPRSQSRDAGTEMIYAGSNEDERIADLIADLGQFDPIGKTP